MEKKMDAIIWGLGFRVSQIRGNLILLPLMENQMDKKIENQMETGRV